MGFEKMMADRELRIRTPEFVANIEKEKQEFTEILKELGKNTLNAGYTLILKAPLEFFANTLKLLYKEKYTGEKFTKDLLKSFFGSDGVMHNIGKVAANAIHLSGKGSKIGIRTLFGI